MNALTAMKHPGALYKRLRDFTGIVVIAVLVLLAILVNPIATRAEFFNSRGCAWPLVLSPEGCPPDRSVLDEKGPYCQDAMSDYYPVAVWCDKSTFIHGGWKACMERKGEKR